MSSLDHVFRSLELASFFVAQNLCAAMRLFVVSMLMALVFVMGVIIEEIVDGEGEEQEVEVVADEEVNDGFMGPVFPPMLPGLPPLYGLHGFPVGHPLHGHPALGDWNLVGPVNPAGPVMVPPDGVPPVPPPTVPPPVPPPTPNPGWPGLRRCISCREWSYLRKDVCANWGCKWWFGGLQGIGWWNQKGAKPGKTWNTKQCFLM